MDLEDDICNTFLITAIFDMNKKSSDPKKGIGQVDSLSILKKYSEEGSCEIEATKSQRTYKEAVYYSVIQLILVIAIGSLTTYSTISYLNMPLETYHTTNYTGDIRTLSPVHIEKRE